MRFFFLGICQVVSGFLVAVGQNAWLPWCGPLAAAFGFAMHWKSLEALSKKQASWVSSIWFFSISLVQLSWMTDIEYQGIYMIFVYLLISLACSWQFCFFSQKIKGSPNLEGLSILGLCSLWTLMEWIRLYFFCGFAFNFVGLSLTCHLFSLQLASISGVLGLSFWTIMTNLIGLKLLRSPRSTSFFLQWSLAVFFPYVYGMGHIAYQDYIKGKEGKEAYAILLVQTGLLPSEKYRIQGREKDFIHPISQWRYVLEDIAEYSKGKVDLIVLPEAVFPFGFDRCIYEKSLVQNEFIQTFGEEINQSFPLDEEPFVRKNKNSTKVSNAYWLQTLSNFLGAQVIAGLDTEELDKNYNSAFFFEPRRVPLRYDKRVLLPLAEYIPFEGLRKISERYGIESFFSPGKEAKIWGFNKIAPSICYDELFSSIIWEGRKQGAKLFVNLTNDGWFPFSKLSKQHFTHGLIRSIENGTPLVRSCSIGITAGVDSVGRVVSKLEENQRGCLFISIP
ncbi:MAG: apolipoprotein N-acyltransferase, partial [Verrucomicrobia bacterium]|nr:apolipoprotein N-acyltransferase [Verrucomicrobiota bacterium]